MYRILRDDLGQMNDVAFRRRQNELELRAEPRIELAASPIRTRTDDILKDPEKKNTTDIETTTKKLGVDPLVVIFERIPIRTG